MRRTLLLALCPLVATFACSSTHAALTKTPFDDHDEVRALSKEYQTYLDADDDEALDDLRSLHRILIQRLSAEKESAELLEALQAENDVHAILDIEENTLRKEYETLAHDLEMKAARGVVEQALARDQREIKRAKNVETKPVADAMLARVERLQRIAKMVMASPANQSTLEDVDEQIAEVKKLRDLKNKIRRTSDLEVHLTALLTRYRQDAASPKNANALCKIAEQMNLSCVRQAEGLVIRGTDRALASFANVAKSNVIYAEGSARFRKQVRLAIENASPKSSSHRAKVNLVILPLIRSESE